MTIRTKQKLTLALEGVHLLVHCCDNFALTSCVLGVAYFSIEITLEGPLPYTIC